MKRIHILLISAIAWLETTSAWAGPRIRGNFSGLEWWQALILIAGFLLFVYVISLPSKLMGRRLVEAGWREQKKWKIDLGVALINNAFYVIFAPLALAVSLLMG